MSRILQLQLGLTLAGAAVWYVGTFLAEPFVSGIGVGMMIAALALRIARDR